MLKNDSTSFKGNMAIISQTLESYGVNADDILGQVGIDGVKVLDSNNRVSVDAVDKVICFAIEVTGDPTFGLRFSDYIHPASYHALSMALMCSSTLRDFCQRLERYFALITTAEKTEFVAGKNVAYLTSCPLFEYREAARRVHADAWAAVMIKLIRMVYQPNYSPQKVELMWPAPSGYEDKYTQFFGVPVVFGAGANVIYFDPADLDIPLPASNAELARQNDKVVVEFLNRMKKVDLPTQVHAKLIEFLPSGECRREKVAKSLNMSVRSFHSKLEQAGTSYQKLLDDTRKELAEDYIKKTDLSVSEIAYLLGFTDVSNFSRAFKRWVGTSPRAYRESCGTTSDRDNSQ